MKTENNILEKIGNKNPYKVPENYFEDDDDTNQSVSSIEDDFVTAFEHLDEEETSKPYNDGLFFARSFFLK